MEKIKQVAELGFPQTWLTTLTAYDLAQLPVDKAILRVPHLIESLDAKIRTAAARLDMAYIDDSGQNLTSFFRTLPILLDWHRQNKYRPCQDSEIEQLLPDWSLEIFRKKGKLHEAIRQILSQYRDLAILQRVQATLQTLIMGV